MRELLGDIIDAGYATIAYRISWIWGEPECSKYIEKLLLQDRLDRKGFPLKVISALMEIQQLLPAKDKDVWHNR